MLIKVLFTKSGGEPATGLNLAEIDITLYRRARATGIVDTVLNAVNPTAEIGGGYYAREYTDDPLLYTYFGMAEYTGAEVLDTNFAVGTIDTCAYDVWNYAIRTLTQTAAAAAAAITGSSLVITKYASYDAQLTGLTIPAAWTKVYVTVKAAETDLDTASMIQLVESNPGVGTDGLLYTNGAAGVAANGSLTVDQVAGTVDIRLEAAATALLHKGHYGYDVKAIVPVTGPTMLSTGGVCTVQWTETRAVT